MKNAGKAHGLANKIRFECEMKAKGKATKWTDVYASEAELIADLSTLHIPGQNEKMPVPAVYKGYEYIHGFAKRVQAGNELTESQMKQAKRLAVEIKIACEIRECW